MLKKSWRSWSWSTMQCFSLVIHLLLIIINLSTSNSSVLHFNRNSVFCNHWLVLRLLLSLYRSFFLFVEFSSSFEKVSWRVYKELVRFCCLATSFLISVWCAIPFIDVHWKWLNCSRVASSNSIPSWVFINRLKKSRWSCTWWSKTILLPTAFWRISVDNILSSFLTIQFCFIFGSTKFLDDLLEERFHFCLVLGD